MPTAIPFRLSSPARFIPATRRAKRPIAQIHRYIEELATDIPLAFLPDYDLDLASALVSGSDVWLNTPLPPLEASGTSGMKAAFNAVPSLSVLDGWWLEGCIENVTGWAIGDGKDATASSHPSPNVSFR